MIKLIQSIFLITCSVYAYSQQGFTIDTIKLFERITTQSGKEERIYASSFYKEQLRFISVEVKLKNHLYQKKKQKHDIQFVWYDSQGIVEGKQDGQIEIQADWKQSTYSSDGWGWEEPGNWLPGEYKVDIYIDKKIVAEQSFTIKEKGYSVKNIKVFGYKDSRPKKKNRKYSHTFNLDSLNYLSVEINFSNLLFKKESHEHSVMLKWYDLDGEYEGKQEGIVNINSEWKSCYYSSTGWGYSEPGLWDAGKYKVDIYIDNYLIETRVVEVRNKEKLISETTTGNSDRLVQTMYSPTVKQLYTYLAESGAKQPQAETIAELVAKKNNTVYKVGKTLFIGTEEQIKEGNYEVASIHSFGPSFSDIISISQFQGGIIIHTLLDDRKIEYKNGSVLDFTVTKTENKMNGQPVKYFVMEYRNGELYGSALFFANIDGLGLQYDPSGNIRNMQQLEGGSGWVYNFVRNQRGFKIINISDPSEIFYFDINGRAILPLDEAQRSNTSGTTQAVGNDRIQDMTINIAQYGTSQNKTVHMHNIERVSVIVNINENGELTRTNTISTGTGKILSHIDYIGDKSAQFFRVTSYGEMRTVKTEAWEVVTMKMSKGTLLGSPWTGKKGNKIYTELANGYIRHTGWQETRNVKLENGMIVRMTVKRDLPNEAPWYGELRDYVYTELENGLFRKTGKTKIVSHKVNDAEYYIKAYAKTGIAMEDGTSDKWSYYFEGKSYEQDTSNHFICTKEYKYDIHNGEIVLMNRDVGHVESAPWSYTLLNGDGYLENTDGVFHKVSETVYIIHLGERVAAIRDLRDIEKPLIFTLSNGVSYRKTNDGITEISKK